MVNENVYDAVFSFRLTSDVLAALDAERGPIPRPVWVRSLIAAALPPTPKGPTP